MALPDQATKPDGQQGIAQARYLATVTAVQLQDTEPDFHVRIGQQQRCFRSRCRLETRISHRVHPKSPVEPGFPPGDRIRPGFVIALDTQPQGTKRTLQGYGIVLIRPLPEWVLRSARCSQATHFRQIVPWTAPGDATG